MAKSELELELKRASQKSDAIDAYEAKRLAPSNAARKLLVDAKPAPIEHAPNHLPVNPEIINASETAVGALQETIVEYAIEMRRRAREGHMSERDGKLVASLSTAAAKLAAEQREQASQLHLSLMSDEDMVQLVVDSCKALGPRGLAILSTAIQQLKQPTKEDDDE